MTTDSTTARVDMTPHPTVTIPQVEYDALQTCANVVRTLAEQTDYLTSDLAAKLGRLVGVLDTIERAKAGR